MRGSLAGLSLALAFSVLLNVLVLATAVWPAWLESRLKFACGVTALLLWVAALCETRGELRRLAREREERKLAETDVPPENPNDSRLREAQRAYLRGDFAAASRLLREAVRADRDDFEARFWLSAVQRRAGRRRSAERMLTRLERLDAARPWRAELADERRRLAIGPTLLKFPADSEGRPTHAETLAANDPSGSRHAA